ncbi:type II secretion system protein GspC [Salinisphaera sp. LB1]|uniref:type II secretion system protein GspC n=1 Tax=Salinisphaera sp. LB1 TaxID=2183911 RepID=UPI000D7062BC|nr:type II secretion system protein GspC [Salinisphaera sp. LB1]AWN17313.1 General secretion pathway protein C [Salinisphaera sp. LB1]
MAMELSHAARRWALRAPDIANLVLVALIALALARLFWLVWPEPGAHALAPRAANDSSRAASSQTIDIDAIASAHLFGEQPSPNAKADKVKQIKAPETHLNLVLTGIVSDSRGDRSRALIKDPKGKQDSYKVGEQIVSGVKLHAIYADRVILDRSGHYETLTLESIKKVRALTGIKRSQLPTASRSHNSSGSTATASGAASRTVSGAVADRIGAIRKEILSNPATASHYIRLRPARRNGNLVGYRVYPGADKSLFNKVGLKRGELVTAINGKPLNNPAASLRLLGSLAHASTATVTVQDDSGQSRTIRIDLQ